MTAATSCGDLDLPAYSGHGRVVALGYVLAMLVIGSLSFEQSLIGPALIGLLAMFYLRQLWRLHARRHWRVQYRDRHWYLVCPTHIDEPVECRFIYLSHFLVVVAIRGQCHELSVAFYGFSTPGDHWRRLHRLAMDLRGGRR